jgi:hypothetical protein
MERHSTPRGKKEDSVTGIEVVALSVAAAWLGLLTIVTLLVVRQIGLITLRLDVVDQPGLAPGDGLDIGLEVPEEATQHLPQLAEGLSYVLLLGGTCAPCRELAPQLSSVRTRGTVLALVTGRDEQAGDLVRMLPPSFEVVGDPAAVETARALGMERTPSVLEIESGVVTGKARISSGGDFQNLIDARDHSDAAEIARRVKEARANALA